MDERSKVTKINANYVLMQAVKLHERCMQEIEPVMERRDGEMVPTGEYKFEHSGAAKALEIIGKHTAVQAFTTKIEISDATDRAARLQRARERAR